MADAGNDRMYQTFTDLSTLDGLNNDSGFFQCLGLQHDSSYKKSVSRASRKRPPPMFCAHQHLAMRQYSLPTLSVTGSKVREQSRTRMNEPLRIDNSGVVLVRTQTGKSRRRSIDTHKAVRQVHATLFSYPGKEVEPPMGYFRNTFVRTGSKVTPGTAVSKSPAILNKTLVERGSELPAAAIVSYEFPIRPTKQHIKSNLNALLLALRTHTSNSSMRRTICHHR
jgi:hypothetical protein